MFKKLSKPTCNCLKIFGASIVLLITIFYLIDVANYLNNFYIHPMEVKISLTTVFFLLSALLVTGTYKITKELDKKHTQVKFTQIFDFLGAEISIPDSKTLTFTYLNKSLLTNTQYNPDELIGQKITNTNPDCEIKMMREFIKPLITEEVDVLKYETIRLRKDGSQYPIQTMMKYFKDTNTLIAFSQDITKQKEVEEVKSEFISIINHKIRTPLTSISGSLKIILNGLVGEIPVPMREMIDMADTNATKLLELINELINKEELESKEYKLDFTTTETIKITDS